MTAINRRFSAYEQIYWSHMKTIVVDGLRDNVHIVFVMHVDCSREIQQILHILLFPGPRK